MTERFAQEIREARVFLDCENLCAFLKRQLGESAQARSNFYDIIVRNDLRLIDDPARKILVVQKILPESLDRRNPDSRKRYPYFGEPHKTATNASLVRRN